MIGSLKTSQTISFSLTTLLLSSQMALANIPRKLERPLGKPEREAMKLGPRLLPIAEDVWKKIASEHLREQYEIVKGDTLSIISARFFGDQKYWPKLWALNAGFITNPHWIKPGVKIAFQLGGGGKLPAMSFEGSVGKENQALLDAIGDHGRSTEWAKLPQSQRWESQRKPVKPGEGVTRNTRERRGKEPTNDLGALIQTSELSALAEITGSRTYGSYLAAFDTAFIKSDSDLQLGEIYGIADEPYKIKSRKSDRSGFSYLLMGTVKIIGVKDGIFIGMILKAQNPIPRGAKVIPLPESIRRMDPVAGPSPIDGIVMIDPRLSSYNSAQFKRVFIDRGSEDGIQLGMVFRAYQYVDPSTNKKITDSDFIVDSDLMVIQVTEKFCQVEILESRAPLQEDATVVLLTDVTDVRREYLHREKSLTGKQAPSELDELDQLDPGGGLGKGEAKELEQLENWSKDPTPTPPTGGDALPEAPSGGIPDTAPVSQEPLTPPAQETLPGDPAAATMPEELAPPPPPEAGASDELPPPPSGDTVSELPVAPPEGGIDELPPPPPPGD